MEVVQGQTAVAEFYPLVVPATATAAIYSAAGSSLATPAVTVDSVSTTLATVTDRASWTLTASTGVQRGRRYWVVPASGVEPSLVTVETLTVASKAVTVYPAASTLPVAGDAFRGARCTLTVPAAATADREVNRRIEWTITDSGGAVTSYRQILHVVRTAFHYETRPEDVRAYIAERWGHRVDEFDDDPTRLATVAERATQLVRRRIREHGQWSHLAGEADAFAEAARIALRLVLVDDGIRDGLDDVVAYTDALRRYLDEEVQRGIRACWVDSDDDGAAGEQEQRARVTRLYR